MKKAACLLLLLLCFTTPSLAAGVIVITHKNVNLDSLDTKTLRYIYLGKKIIWDAGGRIFPAVLEEGPAHQEFLRVFIHKTPAQFTTHWKRMSFAEKSMEIKIFATEKEMMDFVSSQEGAIGYIESGGILPDGVRRLSIE